MMQRKDRTPEFIMVMSALLAAGGVICIIGKSTVFQGHLNVEANAIIEGVFFLVVGIASFLGAMRIRKSK